MQTSRVTIICASAADEARLEPLFHALSRAAKGCRFAVVTADPSRLLGAYGDRYQVWPIGDGRRAVARSIDESAMLVVLGSLPASPLALLRLAAHVARAVRRGRPAVALDGDDAEPRSPVARSLRRRVLSGLREIHRSGDEPLGARAAALAKRYLS